MIGARVAIALSHLLPDSQRRWRWLERILDMTLSPDDLSAIRDACAADGVPLAHYYRWYVEKRVLAQAFRHPARESIRHAIDTLDETDYAILSGLDRDRGVLVCIPHHGHYILSMIALIERLSALRETWVFYGAPATRSGNEIFDRMHRCLFGETPSTGVIHDTQGGIAQAMRALRRNAAVLLMPDAVRDPAASLYLPFFDRPLPVQLGAAALARSTGARLVPAVWQPGSRPLAFRTAIEPAGDVPVEAHRPDKDRVQFHDYRTMCWLFSRFEARMQGSRHRWQHARAHFAGRQPFPYLDPAQIEATADLVFSDPRVKPDPVPPLTID